MPSIYTKRNFEKNHNYHLANFGVLGSEIFRDDQDYKTFIFILSYYLRMPEGKPMSYLQTVKAPYTRGRTKELKNTDPQAILKAFILLPTHFHLVLEEKQGLDDPGISNLMKRLSVTYAMYFNNKYGKTGALYAGKYKMFKIDSDQHLLELTKYLHRHAPNYQSYPYSSYPDYLKTSRSWIKPDSIMDFSRSLGNLSYRTYVETTSPNTAFLGKLTLE